MGIAIRNVGFYYAHSQASTLISQPFRIQRKRFRETRRSLGGGGQGCTLARLHTRRSALQGCTLGTYRLRAVSSCGSRPAALASVRCLGGSETRNLHSSSRAATKASRQSVRHRLTRRAIGSIISNEAPFPWAITRF